MEAVPRTRVGMHFIGNAVGLDAFVGEKDFLRVGVVRQQGLSHGHRRYAADCQLCGALGLLRSSVFGEGFIEQLNQLIAAVTVRTPLVQLYKLVDLRANGPLLLFRVGDNHVAT